MAKKIREFMTHRDPDEHIWVERDESAVIGTARMGQRLVPKIRPFDLLRSAPRSGNRTQVTIWEGDTLRIVQPVHHAPALRELDHICRVPAALTQGQLGPQELVEPRGSGLGARFPELGAHGVKLIERTGQRVPNKNHWSLAGGRTPRARKLLSCLDSRHSAAIADNCRCNLISSRFSLSQ